MTKPSSTSERDGSLAGDNFYERGPHRPFVRFFRWAMRKSRARSSANPGRPTMRIAYVINSVEGGGAALPVPAIVDALQRCGAEVALYALTRRDGRAIPAMTNAGLAPVVRDGGETDHLAALTWLSRAISNFRPDVIWTSLTRATLLGQLVGRRYGIPVVSWQHAAYLKTANRRLLRATRRMSALWIADSAAVSAFAQRELGISQDKIVIWPIFAAHASATRAEPWQPGQPVRIASLGRLHPVKGYDVLIDALAQIDVGRGPSFEVTIGGAGEEHEHLLKQARAAGLSSLSLPGFISEPAQFLASQHLYVQPSRSEGFCVSAHEAMEVGLPVVASNVGEMAHTIVPGVTGALVPPGDPKALANALAGLLANPQLLKSKGEAGRERLLERFSVEQFHRSAKSIVQRLAGLCQPNQLTSPLSIGRSV